MNYLDTITAVLAVQSAIVPAAPFASMRIAKVWPVKPPPSATLTELPAWTNHLTFNNEERDPALRRQNATLQMQLFIQSYQSVSDFRVAHAYLDATIAAFDAAINLHGAIANQEIRGGNPTIGALPFGGQEYLGLDLYLDVFLNDAGNFAA